MEENEQKPFTSRQAETLAKWFKDVGLLSFAVLVFQPIISPDNISIVVIALGLFVGVFLHYIAYKLLIRS